MNSPTKNLTRRKIRYCYAKLKNHEGTHYLRFRRTWQIEQLKGKGIERGFTVTRCGLDDLYAELGRPRPGIDSHRFRWLETPRRGVFVCMGHELLPTPAPLAQAASRAFTLLS